MSGPIRSRRKNFITPIIIFIMAAIFLMTGYGFALAGHSVLLSSLYLPLILKNSGRLPTPTPTVTVEPNKVSIVNFAFQPAELTIHVGEEVEWENNDQTNHTTTSDTGVWNSGALATGQKFSFTFTSVGDFPYHCSIHPDMTGIIHVVPNP